MIKLLAFAAMAIILAVFGTKQQDKEYQAHATVQEWQILIANQDDVPKSQRDKVIAKIATQLQQQINADTLQKKK